MIAKIKKTGDKTINANIDNTMSKNLLKNFLYASKPHKCIASLPHRTKFDNLFKVKL